MSQTLSQQEKEAAAAALESLNSKVKGKGGAEMTGAVTEVYTAHPKAFAADVGNNIRDKLNPDQQRILDGIAMGVQMNKLKDEMRKNPAMISRDAVAVHRQNVAQSHPASINAGSLDPRW
jgi:hypothetical protein